MSLDTSTGGKVPKQMARIFPFIHFPWKEQASHFLLDEPYQFGLLGQKGIMTVVGGHLAVVGLHSGGANGVSKVAYGFGWKKPVGADAHKAEPGANAAERFSGRRVAM